MPIANVTMEWDAMRTKNALFFGDVALFPPLPASANSGVSFLVHVEYLRWLRSLFAFEILRPHIDDLEIQLYRTVRARSKDHVMKLSPSGGSAKHGLRRDRTA